MKVRFFNTYEPVTSFYRDLAPKLAARGVAVEIVLSRGEYRPGRNLERALRGIAGVRLVQMANLGMHVRHGTLAKAALAVLYAVHAGLYALFGPRADVNVFLTQPPFFNIFGLLLKGLRRQPYCCVLMDIQPELLQAAGIVPRESFVSRMLSRVSKGALRRADGVIVIGRCMAEFVRRSGVPYGRVHFIPNWADEREIVPIGRHDNSFRRDQPWSDRFVVLYGGNIGLAQYFDDFVEAADRLREDSRIAFVVVGQGARKTELEEAIRKRNLANVHLYPLLQDRYSLAEILSAGDLQFVPLKEECTGLAVPSKTYSGLAAGRPILYQGDPAGEIARMVVEEKVGTVVCCGDVRGFKKALLDYVDHPETARAQGLKARLLVEGRYSRDAAIERYFEVVVNKVGGATERAAGESAGRGADV